VLTEALTALAAAGGTAVVQAAGTDLWTGIRDRVARVFSHGNTREATRIVERLDQTAQSLDPNGKTEEELTDARVRLGAVWQARFEDLLEEADDREREELATQVRELVAFASRHDIDVSAGVGGVAVGGHVNITANDSSVAAGVIHGGVTLGNPSVPGPERN
jgi:hypothetical protein